MQDSDSKYKFVEKNQVTYMGGVGRQLSHLPASLSVTSQPLLSLAPCSLTILEYSGSLKSIKHTPLFRVICICSANTHTPPEILTRLAPLRHSGLCSHIPSLGKAPLTASGTPPFLHPTPLICHSTLFYWPHTTLKVYIYIYIYIYFFFFFFC